MMASALSYLHLGQAARVKAPNLMEQTVTDTAGELKLCRGTAPVTRSVDRVRCFFSL
jgi:hypothetical protein